MSRCVTQIQFYLGCSYATVRIRVHKTFVDPSPFRVLWLGENPSRGSKSYFVFSWRIRADYDAKFHDLYEHFRRKWKWRTRTQRHRANAPSRKYIRSLSRLLLSSNHWSYHITSKFAISSRTKKQFSTAIIWYQPL